MEKQELIQKPQVTTKVKQTILPHYVELGYIRYDGEFSGKNQFWYVIPQKGIAIYQGESLNREQCGERVEYFHDALNGNSSLPFYLGEIGAKSVWGGMLTSSVRNLQEFTPIMEGDIVEELCQHSPQSSKVNGVQQDTICSYCRIVLRKADEVETQ